MISGPQEEDEQNIPTVSVKLAYIQSCCCLLVLTILGLARTVVWLGQVALHTGAGVGAFSVGTGLAAGPIHSAFIKVCTTETTDGQV